MPAPTASHYFRGCDCPKWLRYSGDVMPLRSLPQRAGSIGLRLGCGVGRKPRRSGKRHRSGWTQATRPRSPSRAFSETQKTIKRAIETFLLAKARTSGMSRCDDQRKLRYQLNLFDTFMAARSRFFPSEITPTDVIEYRAYVDLEVWSYPPEGAAESPGLPAVVLSRRSEGNSRCPQADQVDEGGQRTSRTATVYGRGVDKPSRTRPEDIS